MRGGHGGDRGAGQRQGKARLTVPAGITAEDAIAAAKAEPAVAAALEGKNLVKEIYVKGRLVNLAAKG